MIFMFVSAEFYFNPRSRVGSDSAHNVDLLLAQIFQSTLPCRERLVGDGLCLLNT